MILVLVAGGVLGVRMMSPEPEPQPQTDPPNHGVTSDGTPEHEDETFRMSAENLNLDWKVAPDRSPEFQPTTLPSNILHEDFVGPDACRECHKQQHNHWMTHSHRRMNAVASDETVKGDFSGSGSIKYQGARGEFMRDGGRYRMRITYEDDGRTMLFDVQQTIGSRFFQYYIGVLIDGLPTAAYSSPDVEYVLPFGYWLDRKAWVPVVHIDEEYPDEGERWNPLRSQYPADGEPIELSYAESCSHCHTSQPLADVMMRNPYLIGRHAPVLTMLSVSDYLRERYPDLMSRVQSGGPVQWQMQEVRQQLSLRPVSARVAMHGISCEACHLGCRAHAAKKLKLPSFLPSGEHLYLANDDAFASTGRTTSNLNWVCSRCHQGERTLFSGGMSTWNSTEFSDAARGSCYSKLTCVQCHNPHQGIGQDWTRPLAQDDAVCLKCHQKFSQPDRRLAHTHHAAGSTGDSCINCHMPKLNEGMQNVVRTHMIHSPTMPEMIEAGHPNACNLCHLDKPVDWTLLALRDWYGSEFEESRIAKHYPDRTGPVGRNWLTHDHEAVRLVATATVGQQNAQWALPEIIDQLDDSYLLNRQFARMAVERMLDIELSEFGYQFYMTRAERQQPLRRIRERLLDAANEPAADSVGD